MEKKIFTLEHRDNSRITRIFQFTLGVICIIIAIFWLVFNLKSLKADNTLWITIVFLTGFGAYEILAGLGKTAKFVDISDEKIILKQNSVLPGIELKASDMEKIEILPLSIKFTMKNHNRHILRFGLSYTEIIIPAKDTITEFAGMNKIPVEMKDEEI